MKILISGHTSGLGHKLLEISLKNNHVVYGISRQISKELSSNHQIRADLSTQEGIQIAYEWLENKQIDLFFHCAGSNQIIELEKASYNDYLSSFILHVLSATQIINSIIKKMKGSGGKIFLISSIWSKIACHSRGPYSISKSGINALARQIATEHGKDNIKANSIVLGFVQTPLSAKTEFDPKLNIAKSRLLTQKNQTAQALEIANTIFQIALLETTYLNGSEIILDGGILSQ